MMRTRVLVNVLCCGFMGGSEQNPAGMLLLPSASTSLCGEPGPVAGCSSSKVWLSSLGVLLLWSYTSELRESGFQCDFMDSWWLFGLG